MCSSKSLVISSVSHENDTTMVTCSDGQKIEFLDIWLRDNCRCEKCYSMETYQRINHINNIPETTVCSTEIETSGSSDILNQLKITWSDGHKSTYSLDFLLSFQYDTWIKRRTTSPILWKGSEVVDRVARTPVLRFLNTREGARDVFKSLLDYGVAFIEGVSPNVKSTEAVCRALGGVQHTLFGGMWEFTSVAEHADTAYTTIPLAPHNDSTYFSESTGLQILHCIEHVDVSGGHTVLVDGFHGAGLFRSRYSDHFEFLSRHVSEAEYIESGHHHRNSSPVLRIDPLTGCLEQVRFNVYDRSPMAFKTNEECRTYYAALRHLSNIYQDEENQWWFQLNPGTVLVMDNWRVLHGRSAFSGRRVLCGCYVARSDWRDRARVLGLLH